MDPVSTAITIVESVVRLVQVSSTITGTFKEIKKSKSGFSRELEGFRSCAKLVEKKTNLIINAKNNALYDDDLKNLAKELKEKTEEYIKELEELQLKKKSWLQLCKNTIRMWWKSDELKEGAEAINKSAEQLTNYIFSTYLPNIDASLKDLHNQSSLMGTEISTGLAMVMKKVEEINQRSGGYHEVLDTMKNWHQSRKNLEAQRQCLQALYFTEIDYRKDEIKEAHVKTFQWIMEESEESHRCKRGNFRKWLHSMDHDKNFFWITGKPGAGKSTLMKFLARNEALEENLRLWKGSNTLIVTDFFFWRPGEKMQRSLKGLMQTLVFRILSKRRDLISRVLPDQDWMIGGNKWQFSRHDLYLILEKILEAAHELDLRFMLFIDGLDEFDDRGESENQPVHDEELVKFLKIFSHNERVKICISSRPLPILEKEFGKHDECVILMHELTHEDIKKYVKDMLENDILFQKQALRDSKYHQLVDEIIEAAQGVFLWVYLATRALLDGIGDRDTFKGLQKRLRTIPPKIEDLIRYLLDSIKEEYRQDVARYLLLSESTHNMLPVFHFATEDAVADNSEETVIDCEDFLDDLSATREKIKIQCKGLIEVEKEGLDRPLLDQHLYPEFFHLRVIYAHRTIAEYLNKREVRQNILEWANIPPRREPLWWRSSLAFLAAFWCTDFRGTKRLRGMVQRESIKFLPKEVKGCMIWYKEVQDRYISDLCQLAKSQCEKDDFSYWMEFESIMCRNSNMELKDMNPIRCHHVFLGLGFVRPEVELAISADSEKIFRRICRVGSETAEYVKNTPELLAFAVACQAFEAIDPLLDCGIDPNSKCLIGTWEQDIWTLSLVILVHHGGYDGRTDSVMLSFLSHGANPDVICEISFQENIQSIIWGFQSTESKKFSAADIVRILYQGDKEEVETFLSQSPQTGKRPGNGT